MDFPVYDSDNMVPKDPARRPALEKKIKHYSNFHKILLVGEGDFSFSLALANAFGSAENMVPTSLDSRDKVLSSYDNGQENLQHLENLGAMTSHDVDATKMCKHEILRDRLFDRIVFNFPRAGFYKKEKDAAVIKKHRHLVKMFFKNAKTMLSKTGEIHVTHQVKDPYNQWKVVDEAAKCGLVLKESIEFNKADYPGYTNRRGAEPIIGGTFFLGECRTYTFILRESMTGPIMLPKISEEALPEIPQAMWELEPDRKNREAAHMESLINHLKTVADKAIKERDEFERQRNEAIHQRDEARREKEIITIQLGEALRLKEDAVVQRAVSILEPIFEREARKAAETAKENMEVYLNQYKRSVYNLELNRTNQLVKQGDHTLCQMEEVYWEKDEVLLEKETIAEQVDEAMTLEQEELREMERTPRKQNDLPNQKDEASGIKDKITKALDKFVKWLKEVIKKLEGVDWEPLLRILATLEMFMAGKGFGLTELLGIGILLWRQFGACKVG
ncbi:hypothetical protein KI387_017940 [Taxus chinensis]|uniref:25S rRNA (uridine-N(3))-methyltransferase BMT5-like domain-containing protein n=1 Tax=Taxus chinensis TaxID=29808 RepID=A0AA38LGM9_TAXCH|nr:hypothetical protein KI387_017940 [Taxus chinensis]